MASLRVRDDLAHARREAGIGSFAEEYGSPESICVEEPVGLIDGWSALLGCFGVCSARLILCRMLAIWRIVVLMSPEPLYLFHQVDEVTKLMFSKYRLQCVVLNLLLIYLDEALTVRVCALRDFIGVFAASAGFTSRAFDLAGMASSTPVIAIDLAHHSDRHGPDPMGC